MTEMVSGSPQDTGSDVVSAGAGASTADGARGKPKVVRKGLKVDRIYTTPGVHPYDEVAWERRHVVTTAPQQVSACQPYDSLVSTPAGLVPIGELVEQGAVGTKVYDAHGLTRVVAVKSNGVKEVLRLNLKSGQALDVTADHLVWKS